MKPSPTAGPPLRFASLQNCGQDSLFTVHTWLCEFTMALELDDAAAAYAFRQLVAHLQMRTDVQNIELMTLSGFCR